MKLKDLFQDLALGELSGSPLVELSSYEIRKSDLPKVIQALNRGLEYFYSNFPLKINEVTIRLSEGISRYYLDSMYASSTSESPLQYILDTYDKPFLDDVLHILAVRSADGCEYPLNDMNAIVSIHTPEYNCIQVTDRIDSRVLHVTYQANHPKIDLREPLESNVTIQIPSAYRSALQTYVAHLILQHLGGANTELANNLFAKFKALTEELKLNGIGTVTQTGVNVKPMLRGWL